LLPRQLPCAQQRCIISRGAQLDLAQSLLSTIRLAAAWQYHNAIYMAFWHFVNRLSKDKEVRRGQQLLLSHAHAVPLAAAPGTAARHWLGGQSMPSASPS
jgi:hypothetical protein